MDEAFWASVVKRWSDASENVIKLRKELAKLEEERAAHRCHSDASSASTHGSRPPVSERAPTNSAKTQGDEHASTSTIQDELEDVEIGLVKAKEEYRKLQKELAASSQTIAELTLQNQKLVQDHREEIRRLREEFQSTLTAKRPEDLQSIAEPNSEVEDVSEESRSSTTLIPAAASAHRVVDLKRQIETLKRSVEVSEAEQHDMHHELLSTREKLHKAEANIKTLLASIVKLQAVARYSGYTSLQHASDNSMPSPSRKSSKISFASNKSHPWRNPEIGHSPKTLQPVDLSQFPLPNSRIGEQTIGKHGPSASSTLPPYREKAFSALPVISDDIPAINSLDNNFERAFLKYVLGEGAHTLVENIPGTSEMADKKNIVSSYLCPTLDHHPWCPSIPGQHGYIFVGLGKDKNSYKSAITRNLFVGLPKGQGKHRIFRYLGKYQVSRVEPLSCDEWATLSSETKVTYANLTYGKENDLPSIDDILSAYESGKNQIPCVQLQCIGFDSRFYRALVSSKTSKRKLDQ